MDFYSITLQNVTPLKLVTAKSSYGIGFLTSLVSFVCHIGGIHNGKFVEKISRAESVAMEELAAQARSIGADGVMDVRCQIDLLSFYVCGTAYKLSDSDRRKREEEREAREIARREAEERARYEAAERARFEAEARARYEAEERARFEAAERARFEAAERARFEAEARARYEAEERARREAEEQAKIKAERARFEAEARARHEAEERARREAEEQAKIEAEKKARIDAKVSHLCKCKTRFYGDTCPNCGRRVQDL